MVATTQNGQAGLHVLLHVVMVKGRKTENAFQHKTMEKNVMGPT